MPSGRFPQVLLVLLFGMLTLTFWRLNPRRDALVVYCAHDAEFSEPLLREFERRTGIPLVIQFDTEATKSLSLLRRIEAEKNHPQCDVFWSGELLGTTLLASAGLLEPYQGPGYRRIPEKFREPNGLWTGFAARMRVVIFNKNLLPAPGENPARILDESPARFAMAKPLYGTTLTHYAALWQEWGGKKLQAWHRETRKQGLQEVAGNAKVRDLVAAGLCTAGFTDTDDCLVAIAAKHPVAMSPVRLPSGSTICIPNSLCIIKGTQKIEAARKLVDFLLSAETELKLAQSAARQIPLGPLDESTLPDEVRPLREWARESLDLRTLASSRAACLQWLQQEYLQ